VVGSVTHVAFRGRGYEHAVVLAEGNQVTGIFHHARFARGEVVGLTIEPAGGLAFPSGDCPDGSVDDLAGKVSDSPATGSNSLADALDAMALAK
jgi:hypothetical protein